MNEIPMIGAWSTKYKEFVYVGQASFGDSYTAEFIVAEGGEDAGEKFKIVKHEYCDGKFATDDEAWSVAHAAARAYIDQLTIKKNE